MRVCCPSFRFFTSFVALFAITILMITAAAGQGAYQAQVRGTVTDQSGAIVVKAAVTITNVGTNITQTANTDEHGEYFFTGLRPAVYTVKVQAAGFRSSEKENVVLQVDQQTSVDFVIHPLGVSETMEVSTTAPLLDTESATLGTDISNEYVHELPLANRNFFGLTFLAAGVTEVSGAGTNDNYPSGTNFTSNGQRNATAEIRLDGALISAPEQGEGGNSNVYYEPLVEGMQEMKVQNNSFSAEFGNNGGTVVNMIMKSGSDKFHGSGWYFLQRPGIDARDFLNPAPNPKPDSKRDQGGFSLGGPIKKNRTFFFVDFEKVRSFSAQSGVVTVPTAAERMGDFSADTNPATGMPQNIYDPFQPLVVCPPPATGMCRPQVQSNGPSSTQLHVIPVGEQDAIGMAVLNLYPQPSNANEFDNYNYTATTSAPDYQFDIKIDHQINDRNRISGRYSRGWSNFTTPLTLGDGFDNDGIGSGVTVAQNASLEYTWTVNPRIIWTSHFGVDRVHELSIPSIPTISSFNASLPSGEGLPAVFQQANGIDKMPTFLMQGNLPWNNLYDQCCINTSFGHTLYSYSSQLVISKGSHLIKIGGEQRIFYNNFWQPNYPTGLLTFTDDVTSPTPNSNCDPNSPPNSCITTGNPYASLAFGYADNVNASTQLIVTPSVANRSFETGFYIQDDWKVNSKLTVNLGLRYEWSSPYTSRHNQLEFSNFNADSGVSIDLTSLPPAAQAAGAMSVQAQMQSVGLNTPASQELLGTTQFATSSMRTIPTYRKDVGPRLGFAYSIDNKTVVRGGAGVYFGMSPATNFQYPGSAFRKTATLFFTNNNFGCGDGAPPPCSPTATLENPFPTGFTGPQGMQYGQLANWGYQNPNDLGTTAARDAPIYQWNLGIQRELPSQIVLGVDYVSNRSTHLPWSGTNNRAYIPSALLAQISAAVTPTDSTCQADSCVSNFLATQVGNPFFSQFNSPCTPSASNPCFNEPNSNYGQPTLPLGTLLTTYPQFNGDFEGLMLENANSWYNAMQIRFQKRTTHHVSFEGSYTISKETDDSSVGRNNWVGALGLGLPQQLDRLSAEHSIGASDTPQRLALAVVVDLPVGRKQWIGGNMKIGRAHV